MEDTHTCTFCKMDHLGMRAAKAYLRHLGYEILDEDWNSACGKWDIVAKQGIEIVFVRIYIGDFEMPTARIIRPRDRRNFEQRAICYLDMHRDTIERASVSFSVIYVCVMGEDRAMIRCHHNILAAEDGETLNGSGEMSIDDLLENLEEDAKKNAELADADDEDEPPFDEE